MKNINFVLLLLFVPSILNASWQLKKDKNDIKVYTSQKEGSRILQYKVETTLNSNYLDIYAQVVDFKDNLKFLTTVSQLDIVKSIPDSLYQTFMLLDTPWPLLDRELRTQMLVSKTDKEVVLKSSSIELKDLPVKENHVRIEDFYEIWQIAKVNDEQSTVTVTGSADPAGNIPAWIANLFLVDEPYEFMLGIKTTVEKPVE